jgi:ABC-2 type transport system ATP-binding protein
MRRETVDRYSRAMSAPPVAMQAVTRRFGARVALGGVDLLVQRGEIIGLIGPNGAGKSTLLRIAAGLLRPHGGSVRLFGIDPWPEPARAMQRARFAFAPPALYDHLTPAEHLRFLAGLSGAKPTRAEVGAALETVGLADRAHQRAGTLSFGMRQRLLIALSLLPPPELLVLDEPADGLDPLAVLELRALLSRLRADLGIAILLSSHMLAEIEELVDQVVVLHDGRAVLRGQPRALTAARACLRLDADDLGRAEGALRAHGLAPRRAGGQLELPPGAIALERCAALLRAAGVELRSFTPHAPPLEAVVRETLRAAASARGG